jgi:ribosomal protein S18 acetylase RimI-like enzyme
MRVKVAAMAAILSPMRIRPATRDDIDAVLALWVRAATPPSMYDDAAGVQRLLERDPDALLVAEDDDGALVGSVIAGFDGWRCHLYRMAVDPAARRRGVGRDLVDAAETRFRSLGGIRADGVVLEDNGDAHAFWSAAGYERNGGVARWERRLD